MNGEPPLLPGPELQDFGRTQADLDLWRRGDAQAFERLWRRYEPALEILLFSRGRARLEPKLRARFDAEDVLQDVALVAWKQLAKFEYRGPGSLRAWMERIADHVLRDWLDYWRAAKRHPRLERAEGSGEDTAGESELPAAQPGPATESSTRERRRMMGEALARLSERHQSLIFLRFFLGATWSEIAADVRAPSADAARVECNAQAIPALARAMGRGEC